jgi:hypothetical protein
MKTITINMPDELDNALNGQIEMLSYDGINYTKEQYMLKLMQIGLLKTAIELINEGRAKL